MATKEERNKFLKKHKLDKQEVKNWFSILCKKTTNESFIDFVKKQDFKWKDIPIDILNDMPYMNFDSVDEMDCLAERILEYHYDNLFNEDSNESAKENTDVEISDVDSEEDKMLKKLLSGKTLSESEIKSLVFEYDEISKEYGENRRWSRSIDTVIEIQNHYFLIEWEEGLTENQENEFFNQPVEVMKHEYEKTITVTEWIPVSVRQFDIAAEVS